MAPRKRQLGKLRSTKREGPAKKCAAGSQRAIMPPGRPDVRIIICCPVGKWTKARGRAKAKCRVSLQKHAKKKYALRRN